MKKSLFLLLCLIISLVSVAQKTGKVTGKITDSNSDALSGATITVRGSSNATTTNYDGTYSLDVNAGRQTILVSYVGFAEVAQTVEVTAGQTVTLDVSLITAIRMGDEVVITASKRPEKITRAPAAISVLTSRDFDQIASFNVGALASKLQGVEFVRIGVTGVGINARGFNNAFNAKVLQMTDGRNSMMAGGSGLAAGIMNTVIKEDIDRFEVVLGPNSALYGPNAHNGIANTITKDPRKFPGTTISVAQGNQGVFSGRFRHAMKINNKWAYKFTGEYTTGKDFNFKDSVYAGGGVFGPAVAIPERIPSYQFKHNRGEAHLYYSVTPKADIIASYGGSINDFMSVNNAGRNQIRGWKFSYAQLRFVSPRFFAQAYETWTNVGKSYGIPSYTRDFYNRTRSTIIDPASPVRRLDPDSAELNALRLGNQFKEESKRFNGEAQYNYEFSNIGLNIIVGATYQKDNPNTFGTSLVDKNQKVEVTQYGGALQLEKTLPADFKFVAAARLDHHSLFGELFSPKVALVKGLPGGAVRLTWGKAFAAPIILFQRASVFGFVFGNGNGVSYIPNGGKTTDVPTTTTPLKPEEIKTWELGYKGTLSKKLYVDISGYYGQTKNFLSPALAVGGRALAVGEIPLPLTSLAFPGTINNTTGLLSGATFFTYFNYGEVASYGVDLGVNYFFSDNINLGVKYSYFGSDITEDNINNDANKNGYVALDERSLNAPKNRVSATLSFQNMLKGKMFLNFSARILDKYDFYSGNQIGTEAGKGSRGRVISALNPSTGASVFSIRNYNHGELGGFTTVDIDAGYKINKMVSIGAGVSNLFNVTQREFVGSPSIGRLYSVELKAFIPNISKK